MDAPTTTAVTAAALTAFVHAAGQWAGLSAESAAVPG